MADIFVVRRISVTDYSEDIFRLYSQLSSAPIVTEEIFEEFVRSLNDNHNVIVVLDKDRVIGCATYLIEMKLIRGGSRVMHIEDVVVDREYRGMGLGSMLLNSLKKISEERGCYKMILDCSNEYRSFYEKNGFSNKNIQMSMYR